MKEYETIEEFVDSFEFENIVYEKKGNHDHIHTLIPMISNDFIYALQASEQTNVKHIIHLVFSSFDHNGNFNLDNFIENHDQNYDKNDYSVSKEYLMSDYMVASIVGISRDFSRVMQEIKVNKANHISYITIGRLPSTFQSAAILIKNGFYYETKCLYRVILEQIAYSFQCSNTSDDNVYNLKPQSSITELKKIFSNAGVLNGLFSQFIHHNKNIWNEFIDNEHYIISRSGSRSKDNVIFLAFLAEMYLVVVYDIYKRLKHNEPDELFCGNIIINIDIIGKVKDYFKQKFDIESESTQQPALGTPSSDTPESGIIPQQIKVSMEK
ncbi:hypothetical protein [Aeromonas sp. DNP9]|uniref:hypothetical protein n=1 Tax=Aeromonas sp. DNP9 TaxID=1535548 RepID=UPI00084B1D6F|nr:hypothetical protein [Aeromonas sp. DNP9]OEC44761.1 hypothetical protein A9G06_06135 [Aeromonas sp. DNP9]